MVVLTALMKSIVALPLTTSASKVDVDAAHWRWRQEWMVMSDDDDDGVMIRLLVVISLSSCCAIALLQVEQYGGDRMGGG